MVYKIVIIAVIPQWAYNVTFQFFAFLIIVSLVFVRIPICRPIFGVREVQSYYALMLCNVKCSVNVWNECNGFNFWMFFFYSIGLLCYPSRWPRVKAPNIYRRVSHLVLLINLFFCMKVKVYSINSINKFSFFFISDSHHDELGFTVRSVLLYTTSSAV